MNELFGSFLIVPFLFSVQFLSLFELEEQNHTLKNILVIGISKKKIFLSKLLVSLTIVLLFIAVNTIYTMIGGLLLKNYTADFLLIFGKLFITSAAAVGATLPVTVLIILLRKKNLIAMISVNCFVLLEFLFVWQLSMLNCLGLHLPILIAQQIQLNSSLIVWRNMVDMFIYNNAVLFLPFSVSLIGGYIIDREYSQDTLKNQLVIPIHWRDMIKAKMIVLFFLVIQMGVFEMLVSLLMGIIIGFGGISPTIVFQNVFHILVSNVCITIGVLPIILWSGRTGGKYVWGSILAMLIGISGIFVINGRLVNWHPVTASLSFTTMAYKAVNVLTITKSCIAVALYGLLSIVVYIRFFQKEKVS
ncbi:ABC transporter permease [Acetivibrio ethanolgignens]|uniref:Lantibiotic ABC transporter permease n=1 Tax=Acetivibrio ethanolgignens TaxID=290052 RepID=A0A0V8QFU5_9FIRM|nr:ABC transporter permease [Acetivibrio ethanolgignens]KSV58953.1 hypothetical protein ASU35_10660 [Acetivibrio ethanolgignens]